MAQNQSSAAYDLALFESRKPSVKALAPNKKQEREEKHRSRLHAFLSACAIGLVLLSVLFIVLLMISSRVRLTEMNEQLDTLTRDLGVLQSENTRLSNELCELASSEKVEAYAEKNGMHKAEFHQIEYFTVDGGDRIELPDEHGGGLWAKLTGAHSAT